MPPYWYQKRRVEHAAMLVRDKQTPSQKAEATRCRRNLEWCRERILAQPVAGLREAALLALVLDEGVNDAAALHKLADGLAALDRVETERKQRESERDRMTSLGAKLAVEVIVDKHGDDSAARERALLNILRDHFGPPAK
jgi:hypothetical protein